MAEKEHYFTIGKPASAEFKDRGSKFLSFAYPIETTVEFKKYLQQLRKDHPKAAHHCFAYRLGIDENNFRLSDDGEPSGTAGRPILGQIDSRQLTNILVVVVRYFGGTLLGVAGLINAYKTASSLVLQLTPVIQKQVETTYRIEFDYTRKNDVMGLLKQYNCSVNSQENQLFCVIETGIPNSRLKEVLIRLGEWQEVRTEKAML